MQGVDVTTVINTLTICAGLALGIERSLELLKHFMDAANGRISKGEQQGLLRRAGEALAEAQAALATAGDPLPIATATARPATPLSAAAPPSALSAPLSAVDGEASERYPPPAIPVLPLTPLSPLTTGNQLFFLMAAAGLGVIAAQLFQLRLLLLLTGGTALSHTFSFALLDTLFTGVVIGGGSQPIHVLIRLISERRVTATAETAAQGKENAKFKNLGSVVATASLVAPSAEPHPLQWRDIAYSGGINPASLQQTHLRPGNPNQIVYHHTAMASGSPFQAIVDEFLLTKKWLTGYHCVIMPDGAIKPFCRWDRYGNHAKGHNARSLGLSFHGNFHTAPGDHFSNADGRYGNQQPTEAQLHAGARVVALWLNLYPEIALDFDHGIVAHKEVMPGHTVCPGSNFKYHEFKTLIRQYHEAWAASAQAQQQLQAFRQCDYIYLRGEA
jgi:hypothetical protein